MKKISVLITLLLWVIGLYAQKMAFVECHVENKVMNHLQLFKIQDGLPVPVAKAACSENGYFGFQFIPEYEGFYVLGDDFRNQYPVYLQPGDRVSISINEEGARLEGKKNTRENRLLYAWIDLSHYVWSRSVKFYQYKDCSYKEYFAGFEKFLPEAERFKNSVRSGNPCFDLLMKRSIDFEKDYYALTFIQSYRANALRDTTKMAYYSEIYSPEKLRDTTILQMPYGMRFLNRYAMNAPKPKGTWGVHMLIDSIPNDRLKGELILKEAEDIKTYADYRKIADEFEHLFTPSQKKRMNLIGAPLYSAANGNKAEDFTYPDVNGKIVSLSDFRGKVVVVDVWATWCAPCCAQIPHLKKLEEDMRGKDVVFIGVSVDAEKDMEKWKKKLKDEGLGGIQLFANKGEQIKAAYKIQGIPRFMVFGRDGNIVNIDAPRPDKPELKELIEKELRK